MVNKIGILTSGGDSPGMNACIRAIVRTALHNNVEVLGFLKGYEGLIDNHFVELKRESVSGIIQKGGTILKTARSKRFMTIDGIEKAASTIVENKLEGLVVIGGDGSFKGALSLSEHAPIQIIGCAGTIDNDLVGTDFTIGYDTAINTVVEAIDKIRDTAESHDRVFVIEVMGRDAGLIALRSAIAGGAEGLLVPEIKNDYNELIENVRCWRSSKSSKIIIVSEGDENGGAGNVAKFIKENCPELDVRVSILGHIQRGGSPTCMERVNASIIGFHAVKAILEGRKNEMVGLINNKIAFTDLKLAVKHKFALDSDLLELLSVLSR